MEYQYLYEVIELKKAIVSLTVISSLSFSALPAFAAENGNINITGNGNAQQTITINNTTNVQNTNIELNDIKGHWAERYIKDLVKKGILNGRDDKKFHPEDRVTRAEFAKMTAKFFNLDNQSTVQDFKDVPPDNWAYNYVEAVKNYFDAYQNLNGGLDFHPGQGAERQDVTVTLVKILMKLNPNLTLMDAASADQLLHETFPKDADMISPALRPYVATAVQNNLIRGLGNGYFGAHRILTRAEAATLLDRLQDNSVVVISDQPQTTQTTTDTTVSGDVYGQPAGTATQTTTQSGTTTTP